MNKNEKAYINGKIDDLERQLKKARERKDKMGIDGNWNHFYFWVSQIDQIKETITLLKELENMEA